MARQRVIAQHNGKRSSFEAVLQSDGDTLVLLALTPMGTKAFSLTQEGTQVEYTPYVDERLPFPPRYVLIDVHRTFFLGFPQSPRADGRHKVRLGAETIHEEWRDGRLQRRSFRRRCGPKGTIEVRYVGGMAIDQPPPVVNFRNEWFGYELTIETLAHQWLE